MPIKKAAMKALRQTKKNAARNLKVLSNIKNLLKSSKKSFAEKKSDEAKQFVKQSIKSLDKAVKSKTLKQNTANRLKSKLMKRLNSLAK